MQAGGQDMLENLEADFPEHKRRASGAPHALDGIRVVDFSHFIAGPLATMILADMGAEVIKVEAPVRGDDARRYPPMHPQLDQGAPFVWSNRNKKSIALDLKSPQGLALARDLVCRADVLVENFSSGVMRRLGLDHETCLALNPRLVYCSVAAYSREGAFADRFGFDPIAQAESGFVSMNGYPDREGVRALSPVMDISTAMMVGNAVLGALLARERLGRGQRVEVSLFDTAVLMTGYATMQSLFTGKEPQRSGNTAPTPAPRAPSAPATAPSTSTAATTESSSGSWGRCWNVRTWPPMRITPRVPCASGIGSACSPSSTKRSRGTTGRTGRLACAPPACPTDWCARWARRSARPRRATTNSSPASPIRCSAGFRTCACRSATPPRPWPIRWRPRRWGSIRRRSCGTLLAWTNGRSPNWSAPVPSVLQPQPQPQPCRARWTATRCPHLDFNPARPAAAARIHNQETTMTLHTRRSALRMLAAGGAPLPWGFPPSASRGGVSLPVIRIVVPYPAGGTTDQLARAIAQPMREVLGQTVIVENKPGAGGTIGTDYVAKQPADGYTLVFGNSGPSATAGLMRKLPYDPQKDFRPISGVMRVPMILAVPADSPHKSVAEFVAWARSRGDKVNYGSTGVGGGSHLYSEYFNELAGTRFQHIPYTGAPPLLTAFAGGQVQMAFVTGLDGAAMVQAGKIRYLAVASPKRTPVLPDLPAIAEAVPGFQAVGWFGVLAPAGVPDPVAQKLSSTIAAVVRRPEVSKFLTDRNVEPWGSTQEELGRTIEGEIAQWGPLVKKFNITV
jgi:tripartite-type tricarboxylate transporter receptor subunit TctC